MTSSNRRKPTLLVALAALAAVLSAAAGAAEPEKTRTQTAIENAAGPLMDDVEWRTPNPDFSDPATTPKDYAVRFRWGPYKQHIVGELVGVYETAKGPKEAQYWSFMTYHNPVTDEVTAMQISWDGSLGVGPVTRRADGATVIEQIFYNADGAMKFVRHEEFIAKGADSYESKVYERDETGAWKLKREWTWTRVKK